MNQYYTTADHFSIVPAVMLALFGCAILLFDNLPFFGPLFPDPRQRKWLLIFVVLAEAFTGYGLYNQHKWLADQGFVVVRLDGRGTPRRGRSWERAIRGDLIGPALADHARTIRGL